jgi:ABC-type sugar transport system permease subunit
MKGFKPSAPFLLLLPAMIVLAAVVVVPLLLSLYSSFTPFRNGVGSTSGFVSSNVAIGNVSLSMACAWM